jgi:DNA-binding MarR family transcriptional regulator
MNISQQIARAQRELEQLQSLQTLGRQYGFNTKTAGHFITIKVEAGDYAFNQAWIAEITGLSGPAVSRLAKALTEAGLLECRTMLKTNGSKVYNVTQ